MPRIISPINMRSCLTHRVPVTRVLSMVFLGMMAVVVSGCRHGGPQPEVRFPERSVPQGWPVSSPNARVSSEFGDSRAHGTRKHKGIDISVPEGTPVHATAAGRVRFSGAQSNYGELIMLDHGGGLETVYAHLRKRLVSGNAWVKRGQEIGKAGKSGNATGSHVHYEVRRNGVAVNPRAYISGSLK
ncbi:MAG TPA: M23 family metallopeptidase [Candidatus Hydrogenedentes bacterium]|nr:M23 family metallopeptidase [Candidatus Hydrogenedentota bacterium]